MPKQRVGGAHHRNLLQGTWQSCKSGRVRPDFDICVGPDTRACEYILKHNYTEPIELMSLHQRNFKAISELYTISNRARPGLHFWVRA